MRDLVHHFGSRVAKHPLGADVEDLNDTLCVGGDAREVGAVEDGALQGTRLELGANEQIADDGILRVTQRLDRHHRRESGAILADVGQLVDVLDTARGLEHQGLETRRDRSSELDAQRRGACDQLLRIGNVGGRDLVHHFGSRVAKHPLGTDIEDLDDALGVGGDAREVGAVEDGALQGTRLKQRLFRLARGVVGVLGDADPHPRRVVSLSQGVAPDHLVSFHLADRLRDLKLTLRAAL